MHDCYRDPRGDEDSLVQKGLKHVFEDNARNHHDVANGHGHNDPNSAWQVDPEHAVKEGIEIGGREVQIHGIDPDLCDQHQQHPEHPHQLYEGDGRSRLAEAGLRERYCAGKINSGDPTDQEY